MSRVLEATHKALHERLKPDETTEGWEFAIARKNDPAANMNAQSIVIHSLHRTGAAFLDIDNDGDLDLFLCNYVTWTPEIDKVQGFQLTGLGRAYGPPTSFSGSLCALLRNDGGRYTDISEESGVQVRTPDLKAPLAKALGVAPFDVDVDGLVDIAVANDTVQNFLFHNKGKGKFEEVAILSGVAFDQSGSPRGGMGCDWACFGNDERLGLAIGNFANEMTALYVCDQPASLQFSDLANLYGLGAPTQPPLKFGLFFFDYDLDGRLDLMSANGHLEPDISKVQASERYEQPVQLFWNTGQFGRNLYVKVGPEAAGPDLFKPIVGRGSAYADIDGDGDLDAVIVVNNGPARLFRKMTEAMPTTGFALPSRATARPPTATPSARRWRSRSATRNAAASSSPPRATCPRSSSHSPSVWARRRKADEVTITWPSGKITTLKDLKANQVYHVDEETGGSVS